MFLCRRRVTFQRFARFFSTVQNKNTPNIPKTTDVATATLKRESVLREELYNASVNGDLGKIMQIQSQGVYLSDKFIAEKKKNEINLKETSYGRIYRRKDNGKWQAHDTQGQYCGQFETLDQGIKKLKLQFQSKQNSLKTFSETREDHSLNAEDTSLSGTQKFRAGVMLCSLLAIFYTYT